MESAKINTTLILKLFFWEISINSQSWTKNSWKVQESNQANFREELRLRLFLEPSAARALTFRQSATSRFQKFFTLRRKKLSPSSSRLFKKAFFGLRSTKLQKQSSSSICFIIQFCHIQNTQRRRACISAEEPFTVGHSFVANSSMINVFQNYQIKSTPFGKILIVG